MERKPSVRAVPPPEDDLHQSQGGEGGDRHRDGGTPTAISSGRVCNRRLGAGTKAS